MANNQLKEELILSTQHFDQKIDDVIKKVNKLQSQGNKVGGGFNKSMSSMIQKATGFNGSMASLVGTIGKFAGGIGLAMTATEAFNKTIHSSQTLGDEFARVQESVTSVVDNFFTSLANGDFSPFLNGIDSLINKARDAYDAMDALWNMSQSFGVQNAKLNNTFQKNLLEIRKLKGSKDPKDQQRMKQLVAENEKIIKSQTSGANKLYDQSIKALQKQLLRDTGMSTKISGDLLGKILSSDINGGQAARNKYASDYQKYLDERKKLDLKYEKNQRNGGMGKYGVNYRNESLALEKKYGEAIYANLLLVRYSDEELEAVNNTYKQGLSYQQQAISNQSKLLRYTKETVNAAGGGGGKTGRGGKNTKKEYATGTLGYYESQISGLNDQLKGATNAKDYKAIQQQIGQYKAAMNDISADFMSSIFGDKANFAGSAIEQGLKELQDIMDKHPLHVDVKTDLPKVKASLEDITSVIAELGSSISGLGQAIEDPALEVAGVMAQAIATIILGYAEASKLAGTLGPWAWIGFSAIALGQLTAIIGTVKSLGAYANGGIVGGSSYAGDRLYARVNSGEMILNSQQQSHLFNMINNGGAAGATNGEVQFVIKGSDLYGTLKNYNSKMGKVR